METVVKEKQDSQDLIMRVALDLFTRQGYDGTSIDDIRQAAGYKSKASLYTHFRSKEEVARALLEKWQGEEERVMLAVWEAAPKEPLAGLLALGRAFIEWALDHPQEYTFCFLRVQQEKLVRGEYDYLSGGRESPSYGVMLGLIEQMRRDYPVRAIAAPALLSMVVGMVSKAVVDQESFGPISREERVGQMIEISLGILLTRTDNLEINLK